MGVFSSFKKNMQLFKQMRGKNLKSSQTISQIFLIHSIYQITLICIILYSSLSFSDAELCIRRVLLGPLPEPFQLKRLRGQYLFFLSSCMKFKVGHILKSCLPVNTNYKMHDINSRFLLS